MADAYQIPDATLYGRELQPITLQGYKLVEHYAADARGTITLATDEECHAAFALFDYAGLHVTAL